jgi:ribonuclease P protein component
MRRRFRLRRSTDFDLLWRHGKRWHHPFVVLIVRRNGQQTSRFGFLASKRVGNAIERNRAKRLLREAVRQQLDEIRNGWDCLFIAKRETVEASFADVEAAVSHLLRNGGLIEPGS